MDKHLGEAKFAVQGGRFYIELHLPPFAATPHQPQPPSLAEPHTLYPHSTTFLPPRLFNLAA